MSATFKRKAATANTAGVIVHTTPVNTTALIIGLVLANKGNAAETADVDIDGTYIVKNAPIPIRAKAPMFGLASGKAIWERAPIKPPRLAPRRRVGINNPPLIPEP